MNPRAMVNQITTPCHAPARLSRRRSMSGAGSAQLPQYPENQQRDARQKQAEQLGAAPSPGVGLAQRQQYQHGPGDEPDATDVVDPEALDARGLLDESEGQQEVDRCGHSQHPEERAPVASACARSDRSTGRRSRRRDPWRGRPCSWPGAWPLPASSRRRCRWRGPGSHMETPWITRPAMRRGRSSRESRHDAADQQQAERDHQHAPVADDGAQGRGDSARRPRR